MEATNLATHQRAVRALIHGAPVEDGDPYVQMVEGSENLDVVREIGVWWKSFGIERWCSFTSALLRQRGTFDATVGEFCAQPGLSSFFEVTGNRLLDHLATRGDPLLRSLAAFELALLRAAKGELTEDAVITWEHDPDDVLRRILDDQSADDARRGTFATTVSERLPRLYRTS
jgi:hypothetical protein